MIFFSHVDFGMIFLMHYYHAECNDWEKFPIQHPSIHCPLAERLVCQTPMGMLFMIQKSVLVRRETEVIKKLIFEIVVDYEESYGVTLSDDVQMRRGPRD